MGYFAYKRRRGPGGAADIRRIRADCTTFLLQNVFECLAILQPGENTNVIHSSV